MSNCKRTVFEGCATAIITPFRDGAVDRAALENIIEFQIVQGADAIVVCGTTGEAATLDDVERREVITIAVETAHGRIPIIAGTGCNNIGKAVELSRFASELGADAVMTVTPYYNKAGKSGLIKSFEAIADAVNVPVIIYNVPSRTGIDIPLEVYGALAEHENICAVKEASGNIVTVEEILEHFGDKLDVYSGCDDMILPVLSVGGRGVVSVISNIVPSKVHELCASYNAGNRKASAKLQLELLELIRACFSEVNPIPIKTAMAIMGFCENEMRLPLCELDDKKKQNLKSVLERYALI